MSFSRIFTSLPLKFVTKHSCPKLVQNQVATGVGCINCPRNFIRSKRITSKDLKSLSGKAAPGQKAVALKLGISQVSISYILMEQVIHRYNKQREQSIPKKEVWQVVSPKLSLKFYCKAITISNVFWKCFVHILIKCCISSLILDNFPQLDDGLLKNV